MPKSRLDIRPVAAVRARDLGRFLEFIAEHNLWDEVEQDLKDHGCTRVLVSREVLHTIATIVEAHAESLVETTPGDLSGSAQSPSAMRCASNGTNKPKPNTPKREKIPAGVP